MAINAVAPRQILPRRWRVSVRLAGCLAAVYGLLLLPEWKGDAPARGNHKPFLWNQDALWSRLEADFVAARGAGESALTNRIDALVSESDQLMHVTRSVHLGPDAVELAQLETNLFLLAPLVGAFPQRLPAYAELVNRTRQFAKVQSESWDLKAIPARERLYRLLFGPRMALEEVMLQAPAEAEKVPVVCVNEPSLTPAADFLGVKLHSGDILVSRGGAPTSALIARGNDYPGSYSHVALVHVDAQTGQPSIVEALIERGVAVSSVEHYLESKKLRLMLLRLRADLTPLRKDPMLPHTAATRALVEVRSRHIPYDFTMDSRDHRTRFCSEVVCAAYEFIGIELWMGITHISSPTVVAWLGSMGVKHFETKEPADLEYDPQLQVVAEWREPAALYQAHIDDAVTDLMLAEAVPGQGLDYPRWQLPIARLCKAYSAVLNFFGATGKIPEGMSATAALRLDGYQHAHATRAARLRVAAEEFKRQHGYAPPYWELLKLGRHTPKAQARTH